MKKIQPTVIYFFVRLSLNLLYYENWVGDEASRLLGPGDNKSWFAMKAPPSDITKKRLGWNV